MAHDTARVSPRLHQAHENWEASHDFPRFSDESLLGGLEYVDRTGFVK